jgi:hypothetical protein
VMCAVVTGLVACDGPRPSGTDPGEPPPIVSLGAGASMTFPSEVQGEEEVDGDRHAFRRDDGVVWSVQPLQRGTSGMAPPTLDAVAIALVHRVELDEVEGELTHRNCTFGGRAAQCIEGWQAGSDGERVLRRGAIVELSELVVWVAVSARAGSADIDALAESLATNTSFDEGQ